MGKNLVFYGWCDSLKEFIEGEVDLCPMSSCSSTFGSVLSHCILIETLPFLIHFVHACALLATCTFASNWRGRPTKNHACKFLYFHDLTTHSIYCTITPAAFLTTNIFKRATPELPQLLRWQTSPEDPLTLLLQLYRGTIKSNPESGRN